MVENGNVTSVHCVADGEEWSPDLLEQHDLVIFRRMSPEDFEKWATILHERFPECQVVGVSDLDSVAPSTRSQLPYSGVVYANIPA